MKGIFRGYRGIYPQSVVFLRQFAARGGSLRFANVDRVPDAPTQSAPASQRVPAISRVLVEGSGAPARVALWQSVEG